MFIHDINKNIKVPLHYQIYLDLLGQIQSGEILEGHKIPAEPKLEEIYGVSRVTVRGAVEMLAQEGLVEKNRGRKGTVVCKSKRSYDMRKLTSVTDDVHLYGERAGSELLEFKLVVPCEKLARLLELEIGEKVYLIERIRYRQGIMVGLHRSYIRRLNNLVLQKEQLGPDSSLYELLKKKGIEPSRATEVLEVKIPGEQILSQMGLKPETAVFYKERVTYANDRQPFEAVEMYYIAEYYQYRVELQLN